MSCRSFKDEKPEGEIEMLRRPRRFLSCRALFHALPLFGLAASAVAGEFYEKDGVAIRGYDPVAYFTEGKSVAGSQSFTSEYKGSLFRFASVAHRDAFAGNPRKYAPQYGGYCALGMAKGYKASIDPTAFSVVGGKLYLNYSLSVREQWQEDIPGYIAKADKNWPDVKNTTKVHE
jgi:YHS domain-containing protein